jgi:iron complex outermembrane recepter protein
MTNQTINTPVTSSSDVKDTMASVNIDYRLGDLTLSSTTAYQRETQFNLQDIFVNSSFYSNNFRDAFAAIIGTPPGSPGTWATFNNTQFQDITVTQTSQEFRLASSPDRPLNYVAGLFFSDSKVDLVTARTFTPAETDYDVESTTKTYDIYGRATYKFPSATSLIAGLRFNHDVLSYTYDQLDGGGIHTANSDNSNAVVGDIGVQQQLAPHSMVYATYSRGYAPRVFNTGVYSGGNAAAPSAPLPITAQEHIDNFEIGSKGMYFDQRLQLNAALFYTVYKDYQVQTSESIPGQVAPILGLTPAGKARTEGLEIDSVYAPTNLTRIGINMALIDAKFITYTGAPCWGNGVTQTDALGCTGTATRSQDVSGKTMPDSPRFKGNLFAEQKVPFGASAWEGVFGGTYAYRTRTQFQPDQNPQSIQGAFGLLNLSFAARERSGKYAITAFVDNVTNHHYYVDLEDFWSGPWNANTVVGQPARDANRFYGLRLQAGF